MDPLAALTDARVFLKDEDFALCSESLGHYFEWKRNGGFTTPHMDDEFLAILRDLGTTADMKHYSRAG